MTWSSLKGKISGERIPELEFVARSIPLGPISVAYGVSSHELSSINGVAVDPGLLLGSVRVQGSSLSMRQWAATGGGFSFAVAAERLDRILGSWVAGGLIELLARPARAKVEGNHGFTRIAIGVLDRIRHSPGRAEVSCNDVATALRTRFETLAEDALLFSNLPGETVATVDGVSGTTVTLDDASLFEKGTSAAGVFKTAGGSYYKFTGKSGDDLTGVTLLDGSAGVPLTGVAVQPCAYLTGHPVRIALRVLTSTGDGTNGDHDDFPKTWGYGLPASCVNTTYSRTFAGDVGGVASDLGSNWHIVVEQPVSNGWTWINSWLNPAGLFVDHRQGSMIVSSVQTPHVATRVDTLEITDDMIKPDGIEIEFFDPQAVGEYGGVKLDFTGDGEGNTIFGDPSADEVATLPVIDEYKVLDFSAFTNGLVDSLGLTDLVGSTARTAIETNTADRIGRFYTRRGERLSLTLAGFEAAGLHRGVVVRVKSRHVTSRLPDDLATAGALYMITRVAPAWNGNETRLSLVAVPPDEKRFHGTSFAPFPF